MLDIPTEKKYQTISCTVNSREWTDSLHRASTHNHVKFPELILSSTLTSAYSQGKKTPCVILFPFKQSAYWQCWRFPWWFLAVLHLYIKRSWKPSYNLNPKYLNKQLKPRDVSITHCRTFSNNMDSLLYKKIQQTSIILYVLSGRCFDSIIIKPTLPPCGTCGSGVTGILQLDSN